MNNGSADLPRLELPKPKNVLPFDSSIAFFPSSSSDIVCASAMILSISDWLAVSFVEEVLVPFPPHPTNDAASTTESTDDKKRLLIIFPPDE